MYALLNKLPHLSGLCALFVKLQYIAVTLMPTRRIVYYKVHLALHLMTLQKQIQIVCLKHALRKKRTCAHLLLESFWNDHRVSENSVDDTKEVIT